MLRPRKQSSRRLAWLLLGILTACTPRGSALDITELPTDAPLVPVIQTGHSAAVSAVAFSPDGRYALSASRDHSVKLWDVRSGREIRTFKGHTDAVSSVAYAPGGRYALSGGWDGTIRLWDIATGEMIYSRRAHDGKILTVAVSPRGGCALSGGSDQAIVVSRLQTGYRLKTLHGYAPDRRSYPRNENARLTSTSHADRDHGALGDYYRTRILLDAKSSSDRIMRHIEPVTSAVFDRTGNLILSGSLDGTLRLWHREAGHRRRLLNLPSETILSVALSPDGQLALVGTGDQRSLLVDVGKGRRIRSLAGQGRPVKATAFSPDGRWLATGGDTIMLWDREHPEPLRRLTGNAGDVNTLAFSPEGRYLLSGHTDGRILLWETATGLQLNALEGTASAVNAMALLPGGNYLLTGNQDGSLKLWDTAIGRQEKVYRGSADPVLAVALSSDGRTAAAGNRAGAIALWDVFQGKRQAVYAVDQAPITTVALSPGQRVVVAGTGAGSVVALEIPSGRERWRIQEAFPVNRVVFSANGTQLLCATEGKPFTMRDTLTGKILRRFGGHLYGVATLFFADDDRTIVSGGGDRALRVWDANNGRLLQTLRGHKDKVTTGAVSADGRRLISGGDDHDLIVWDRSHGTPALVLSGHADRITGVGFSPAGEYLYSGSRDATLRKWLLPTGEELGRMHGAQGGEWITTTPDGYYANSPEGHHLVHWVMHGRLEAYSYEQFEALFNKPEVVKARFQGRLDSGRPAPELSRPPVFEMPHHRSVVKAAAGSYPLQINLEDHLIRNLRIFVNGRPEREVSTLDGRTRHVVDVPLLVGANRITAVAYDARGFSSVPQYLDVICGQGRLRTSDLYVLAVGVSRYPLLPSAWQLDFAHRDANAVTAAARQLAGRLYREVHTTLLTNADATVETVTASLSALENISTNDLAVIFLAGHGIRDETGAFFFLTTNSTIQAPQEESLNWMRLKGHLRRIRARVIVFLDACHSGALVTETVVPNNELAQRFFVEGRSGVLVFSASKGRQYSLESPDIGGGHGLFTFAILTTLTQESRQADRNRNGYLEFMELAAHVTHYVDAASGGQQTPWISRKELFGDLPLAEVN